jgi:hypothetical protein
MRKMITWARKALKMSYKFDQNFKLSVFEMFESCTHASGGPHAARVFETPGLEFQCKLSLISYPKTM